MLPCDRFDPRRLSPLVYIAYGTFGVFSWLLSIDRDSELVQKTEAIRKRL